MTGYKGSTTHKKSSDRDVGWLRIVELAFAGDLTNCMTRDGPFCGMVPGALGLGRYASIVSPGGFQFWTGMGDNELSQGDAWS